MRILNILFRTLMLLAGLTTFGYWAWLDPNTILPALVVVLPACC